MLCVYVLVISIIYIVCSGVRWKKNVARERASESTRKERKNNQKTRKKNKNTIWSRINAKQSAMSFKICICNNKCNFRWNSVEDKRCARKFVISTATNKYYNFFCVCAFHQFRIRFFSLHTTTTTTREKKKSPTETANFNEIREFYYFRKQVHLSLNRTNQHSMLNTYSSAVLVTQNI